MKKWQIATTSLAVSFLMVFAVACSGESTSTSAPEAPKESTTETNTTDTPSNAASSAVEGDTPQVTWKLAHTVQEDTAIQKASLEMAKNLADATGGNFVLDVYPNSQLGGNREVLEALQFGTCELDVTNVSLLSGYSEKMAAFELPYLIKDDDSGKKVFDSDIINVAIDPLETNGLKWIGSWFQGWRHVTTKNTEVHTPADMKGLKIRTMDSQIHMDHFNSLGASAVPMAFSEVFTGLQQGAIDGQENPYVNIYTQGMHEVQKYIIETGHIYDITPLLMSLSEYEKLPENYQKLVVEQGEALAPIQREYSVTENEEYKQKIVDLGKCVIVELSDEERQAFRDAAQPVYDKWSDQIGQDLLDQIAAAQE